jgi:hypothetical protein
MDSANPYLPFVRGYDNDFRFSGIILPTVKTPRGQRTETSAAATETEAGHGVCDHNPASMDFFNTFHASSGLVLTQLGCPVVLGGGYGRRVFHERS